MLVFPYTIETKMGPWELSFPILSYLHKLTTVIFLVMAFGNPVIQLILIMLLNVAYLVYIVIKKPFFRVPSREYNHQIYIHNISVLIIMEFILLIFVFLRTGLDTNSKILICNFVVATIIWGFIVNIIYFVFRTYHFYHHFVWKTLVRSDFFRINYIV